MEPREYEYGSQLRWTGEHKGVLSSASRHDIEVACPSEFGGHPGYWTPEHLFVSSVEVCIMTTFLSIFERSGGSLVSYRSEAVGRARIQNWAFQFVGIEVSPSIHVSAEKDVITAREAIQKAARECLITRSLKFAPIVQPAIEIASTRNERKGR